MLFNHLAYKAFTIFKMAAVAFLNAILCGLITSTSQYVVFISVFDVWSILSLSFELEYQFGHCLPCIAVQCCSECGFWGHWPTLTCAFHSNGGLSDGIRIIWRSLAAWLASANEQSAFLWLFGSRSSNLMFVGRFDFYLTLNPNLKWTRRSF